MTQHTFHPQTLDPRSAGKVTRYHTWERLKDQSTAEHTWQVIRLLLAIWPDVPRHVLVYAMFHDTGERVTGDVPYPVKAERPAVKEAFDAMEEKALHAMVEWGVAHQPLLSEAEKAIFKLVEFIEMWEYALDEVALGNLNCVLIATRCLEQARVVLSAGTVPPETHHIATSYIRKRSLHEHTHRRISRYRSAV